MLFYLQFRDGPTDAPIQEITSPLPLPVPRRGDEVEIFGESKEQPPVRGTVVRVRHGYQPVAADPQHDPTMDFRAQVWLDPKP